MKNVRLLPAVSFAALILFYLIAPTFLQAGEIILGVGDTALFASGTRPDGQDFEAFKFNLPTIPPGSRIDYAGLVFHIQRDTVRYKYLPLRLAPVTSNWTAGSVRSGQVLSVDSTLPAFAVAFDDSGDRVEMNITDVVAAWVKGNKTNQGFMLVPELLAERTNFTIASVEGIRVKVIVYYTGPEVKK